MRKYASVFALYARSAVFKLLGILLVMTAAEALLFHQSLRGMLALAASDPNQGLRFEEVLSLSRAAAVFLASAALLAAALCVRGSDYGAREGCTLMRLRISERGVFCMQWLFSSLAFVTLWAWQTLLTAGFAAWYGLEVGERFFNPQTLFLAAYRSDFFHSLLPMSNLVRWLRNLVLAASLGACCAKFGWSRRRGARFSAEIVVALAAGLVFFVHELPGYWLDVFCIAVAGIAGAYAADKALGKGEENEEA